MLSIFHILNHFLHSFILDFFFPSDSAFTERVLGLPNENYKGYVEADATQRARHIPSHSYFLIHGLADSSAPYLHGTQLARALAKAGVIFQYQVRENVAHHIVIRKLLRQIIEFDHKNSFAWFFCSPFFHVNRWNVKWISNLLFSLTNVLLFSLSPFFSNRTHFIRRLAPISIQTYADEGHELTNVLEHVYKSMEHYLKDCLSLDPDNTKSEDGSAL